MGDQTPTLTRVYVTADPLTLGRIVEVDAEIHGDRIAFDYEGVRIILTCEGRIWHRRLWAAQNDACQVRDAALAGLREQIDRLERLDFGRRR